MNKPWHEVTKEECMNYIPRYANCLHKVSAAQMGMFHGLVKRLQEIKEAEEIINPKQPSEFIE
jgi:hypothetical protein